MIINFKRIEKEGNDCIITKEITLKEDMFCGYIVEEKVGYGGHWSSSCVDTYIHDYGTLEKAQEKFNELVED